jgi:hypothetical protein
VTWRSLASAGITLRSLRVTLLLAGSIDFSRNTSWMRTYSLLRGGASSGGARASPSRKILVPISLIDSSICPPREKRALNELMCGSTVSASVG